MPKSAAARPDSLKPDLALRNFHDRAMETANPHAGLFAIAFALTLLGKAAMEAPIGRSDDAAS